MQEETKQTTPVRDHNTSSDLGNLVKLQKGLEKRFEVLANEELEMRKSFWKIANMKKYVKNNEEKPKRTLVSVEKV